MKSENSSVADVNDMYLGINSIGTGSTSSYPSSTSDVTALGAATLTRMKLKSVFKAQCGP